MEAVAGTGTTDVGVEVADVSVALNDATDTGAASLLLGLSVRGTSRAFSFSEDGTSTTKLHLLNMNIEHKS